MRKFEGRVKVYSVSVLLTLECTRGAVTVVFSTHDLPWIAASAAKNTKWIRRYRCLCVKQMRRQSLCHSSESNHLCQVGSVLTVADTRVRMRWLSGRTNCQQRHVQKLDLAISKERHYTSGQADDGLVVLLWYALECVEC